jgi:hypothetical protein
VVDIEEPIDQPENILEYVGRYTHRVAISNDRLISLKDGKVTFAYKNRETKKMQTTTVEAVEFIRRFLKKGAMKKLADSPKCFDQNPYYLIHPDEFRDTV